METLPARVSHSHSSDTRTNERPRSINPKIQRLIGELALRYPPQASADKQQFAAQLALLAKDCADLDPEFLEAAIDQHVRTSPYMPKACDLRNLAGNFAQQARRGRGHERVEHGNAHLREIKRDDVEWYLDGEGNCKIRHTMDVQRPAPTCSPEAAAAIMAEFRLSKNPLDPSPTN